MFRADKDVYGFEEEDYTSLSDIERGNLRELSDFDLGYEIGYREALKEAHGRRTFLVELYDEDNNEMENDYKEFYCESVDDVVDALKDMAKNGEFEGVSKIMILKDNKDHFSVMGWYAVIDKRLKKLR